MPLLQLTLYKLVTPQGINPAWWKCPIQQGVPAILNLAYDVLLTVAALAFMVGILMTVFQYLTAYGDEAKIKKGRQTLQWTVIGAIVILLSAVVMQGVVGLVIDPSERASLNIFNGDDLALRGTADDPNQTQVQLGKNPDQCSSDADTQTQQQTTNNPNQTSDDAYLQWLQEEYGF